jgi:hypothetical protein
MVTFCYLVDVSCWMYSKTEIYTVQAQYTANNTAFSHNMSAINTLCARFIWNNRSLWLVDCTPAICCEKCEVPTYSSQKMSLKAAKFHPRLTHLPRRGPALAVGFMHWTWTICCWLFMGVCEVLFSSVAGRSQASRLNIPLGYAQYR